MAATRVLGCAQELRSLLLLLLPQLLHPQLLLPQLLLSRLLLPSTGAAESEVEVLFARPANAVRHQDGADQLVITARLRAANLISEPAMPSMSHLLFLLSAEGS